MKAFPLFITVADRPLIVFGGGEEAAAKIRLLLKTDARLLAVASEFEPAVADLDGLTRITQDPLTFDLPANTPFAYAATGDADLDADLARQARAVGVLVCAVDQPDVSDFSTPALVDRDPVVVAIGTEGTAPVLARAVKAQVEFLLEPSLGLIARTAASLRQHVAKALEPGEPRRTFWRRFFNSARKERMASEDAVLALGKTLLTDASSQRGDAPAVGSLTIVGTGAGEADLLAIAGHRALDTAAVVLYDPLVSRSVLELARREAILQRVEVGGQAEILRQVAAGHQVVRLVSGSGALAEREYRTAQAAGLSVRLIPGTAPATDLFSNPERATNPRRASSSLFSRKAA
ncbi:MAG: uroporphyrinogen-III C-methyltransferase [Alphaproteobacteria bacterium TMED89]|nr:siroheme synthase [Rhodospirillaceae bacterium]RPH14243.1 MAG: uroporphyrinogen-III C-methyltransferase [Alphaproteobacteria bacterium TMED89]